MTPVVFLFLVKFALALGDSTPDRANPLEAKNIHQAIQAPDGLEAASTRFGNPQKIGHVQYPTDGQGFRPQLQNAHQPSRGQSEEVSSAQFYDPHHDASLTRQPFHNQDTMIRQPFQDQDRTRQPFQNQDTMTRQPFQDQDRTRHPFQNQDTMIQQKFQNQDRTRQPFQNQDTMIQQKFQNQDRTRQPFQNQDTMTRQPFQGQNRPPFQGQSDLVQPQQFHRQSQLESSPGPDREMSGLLQSQSEGLHPFGRDPLPSSNTQFDGFQKITSPVHQRQQHSVFSDPGHPIRSTSVVVSSGLKNLPALPALVYSTGTVPSPHAVALGGPVFKGTAFVKHHWQTPYARYVYSHVL